VRAEAEQVVREIPPPATKPADSGLNAPVAPTDTTWITMDGYRLQVFASVTREQAEAAAERARQRFPQDSVYIVFITPLHRVRVGDFRTVQEAEAKLIEAQNKGYRDVLYVRSPVRVIKRPGDRVSQ